MGTVSNYIDWQRDLGNRRGERDLFQTQTYPVENAILEIYLNASGNVLDLFPMIDLAEVDANLVIVRVSVFGSWSG